MISKFCQRFVDVDPELKDFILEHEFDLHKGKSDID